MDALDTQKKRMITYDLVNLIKAEVEPAKRTILLDALINYADPGNVHQPLSETFQQILPLVSPYEKDAAIKRLKKRRKDVWEELKKTKLNE